jgi:hypothetical protein
MNAVIQELVNRKVTVYSATGGSDVSDVGVIERVDTDWVKLRKGEREVLYLNVDRIRLIKPFDPL